MVYEALTAGESEGITLLYILTGKRPYEGESAFAIVLAHANKPLPSGEGALVSKGELLGTLP